MPVALICSPAPLDDEISQTVLARENVLRYVVRAADDVLKKALELKPQLILLDRDMPMAARILASLRKEPATRGASIVVVARGEHDSGEVELLEAGANAILRLPVSPEWDERLERLLAVPVRRQVRIPVSVEVEADTGAGIETFSATALNLSVNGMLIDTLYALRIGDDVDFSFQIPGTEIVVSGCGRVVRQAGRTQFGVEFYGLEGEGRDQIAAWMGSGSPA